MKIFSAIIAFLSVCVLMVSCSHPTTPPPGPNPGGSKFTVTATIDGAPYSAGATMTVGVGTPIPSNYLIDLKSTSGSRSLELVFIFPTNTTFPKNLTQSQFNSTYTESNASFQDSAATASATVNSLTYSYADTTFSADFSFKAPGGVIGGTQSIKNITGGTVRTN